MAEVEQINKRAEEAFNKRNYDYARDLFSQSLILKPDQVHARKALRATIVQKFKEQGAPGKFTIMTKNATVNTQIAMSKNKPDKLVEVCSKHLLEDPGNSKVRGTLAQALYELKHVEGAATEAEMALEYDAKNLAAAKCLVQCFKDLGKIKEAQDILLKAEAHSPDDRDLNKLQRDLAATATMKKGFEDTKGKGMHAVIKDADKAAELERAQHLIKSDEDLQGMLAKLESEMGENPTDPRLPKKIGDLQFEIKKDYKTARDWYQKAANLAPQDSVLKDKVDDCTIRMYDVQVEAAAKATDPRLSEYRANRLKFTIASFERRVLDRPTDMSLRFQLGKAYFTAGASFLDKAIAEFQQSVKDPKQKIDSHLFLGQAFQRRKIFDMADTQYQKAEEAGILGQEKLLFTWYNRAICLAESGNFAKAIEYGKKIMEENMSYKDIAERVDRWQKGQV